MMAEKRSQAFEAAVPLRVGRRRQQPCQCKPKGTARKKERGFELEGRTFFWKKMRICERI